MTKEEIGEMVAALPEGLDADEFIFKLVNWAVDREREACAKIVESDGYGYILIKAAARIRARSEK